MHEWASVAHANDFVLLNLEHFATTRDDFATHGTFIECKTAHFTHT